MKNVREVVRGNASVSLEFTNKTSIAEITLLEDKFTLSTGLVAGDYKHGNYTELEKDGTLAFKGKATVWDDLVNSLIARRLNGAAGALKYNYSNNTITMEPDGDPTDNLDRLIFNLQKPHKAKIDSTLNLHIHWEQTSTDEIKWQVDYRIQDNNAIKTEAWTTVTATSTNDSVYTYPGSGTFNQITELAKIDWSQHGISATVQVRLTRIDKTADDIEAVFVDGHVEYDTLGSREEYIK